MLKSIDVVEELNKERYNTQKKQDALLFEVEDILQTDASKENEIKNRIFAGNATPVNDAFSFLEEENIYSVEVIRKTCAKYRLRFLDAELFKGDIPEEAIFKIKEIEKKAGTKIESFKIIAPAVRFKLKDSTKDPVLLADLGNGKYYKIHKWGNDMSAISRVLSFPLQNATHLGITAVIFGIITSMLLPDSFLPATSWDSVFKLGLTKIYLSFIFASFFFVGSLILGILTSKEFSEDVWNSKFFN